MAPGPVQRVSYLYRVAWWASALLALAVPLLLVRRVGFDETWDAFNRYTVALLEFSGGHQILVPGPLPHRTGTVRVWASAGGRDKLYTQMDADLILWHREMTVLHNRIGSMAVVGKVDADGLDIEFNRPAALKGARKGGFLPARDLSMLAYLLLSAAAHLSGSVPLSLVVLNLQLFCLAICLRLKGVNDALGQAVDALQDAQQDFLLMPLEASPGVLQMQHLCLAKLTTLIHEWTGQSFGMAVVLPGTSTGLAISINVMASLTLATMLRCLQVVAHGFYPRLPMLGVRGLIRKFLSSDGGGEDGGGGYWRRGSRRKLE